MGSGLWRFLFFAEAKKDCDTGCAPAPKCAISGEIVRMARKELKPELQGLRKAITGHRSEIAALKREVKALTSQLKATQRQVKATDAPKAKGI
eukprot:gene8677-11609_t